MSAVMMADSWEEKVTTNAFPAMMMRVAATVFMVTTSPRITRPKKTLEMNCAEPSAASRDCAAKENETKFRIEPVTKKNVPMYQIVGFFTLFVEAREEEEDWVSSDLSDLEISDRRSFSTVRSRRVWPCFIRLVPPLMQIEPVRLRQIPVCG